MTADKTAFKDGRNSATTAAFTTSAANEVLLAFVSGDGPMTLGQTATARTVGTGQSIVHQWVDTPVGDTFWSQCANAASAAAGAVVTLNDAAPTADQSNFVAVEIIP